MDDSVGEVIDKAARMLDIPYNSETNECAASKLVDMANYKSSDLEMIHFAAPTSSYLAKSLDFSFSGLKTALKDFLAKEKFISNTDTIYGQNMKAKAARGFLYACSQHLGDKLVNAIKLFGDNVNDKVVISGGVARNEFLFSQ